MGHSESFEQARRESELHKTAGVSAQAHADALELERQMAERAARVRAGLLAYRPYEALNQRLKGGQAA